MKIATDTFEFVSVGAQDGSRASVEVLRDFIGEVINCGGKRVRIADTVGTMNPVAVQSLFGDLSTLFPDIELEFHAHNDLGMATANTILALQSGATAASMTVNGLGERAGNAALEEVVAGLKYACDAPLAYDFTKMQELCAIVAEASNRHVHPSKPITGTMVCSHESGIHCRSLVEDPLSYHAFNPADIGKETNFFIGKHSGATSVVETLRAMGIHISMDEGRSLLPSVKQKATLKKTSLNKLELLKLFYEG